MLAFWAIISIAKGTIIHTKFCGLKKDSVYWVAMNFFHCIRPLVRAIRYPERRPL